jgi:hypothetical protein
MNGIARYVAAAMLVAGPAHANWLDRAWDDDAVAQNLAPAITLGEAGVLLVLPQATLDDAHAAGVSTPDAVRQLVERYGQHCSAIVDLNQPHPHLKVRLFIARRVPLADAPQATQREVRETVKSGRTAAPDTLAVTSDDYSELVIDYVPARTAHCVTPGDAIS